MSSFYAELEVAGATYPLRQCNYEFTQATDERGRVVAKVRHGRLQLTLDVPEDEQLLAWAVAPHKPLAGHVTFYGTDQRMARETVSWEVGQCIGYQELFEAGDAGASAYVCQLVIATTKLTLSPGSAPKPFVAAAPRDYDPPPVAVSRWTGGAVPGGMSDTVGTFSGRRFDPENCGGPIIKATWQGATITAKGIATVQTHVGRYGADPDNEAMIARLRKIEQGQLAATDWDKRFYTHELREYERYRALNIPDDMDPGREVWNNAHTATLEDFGLGDYDTSNRTHNLYHPEI